MRKNLFPCPIRMLPLLRPRFWLPVAAWLLVIPITSADEIDESLLQMLYLRNFIGYSQWQDQHTPTILAVITGARFRSALSFMQKQHAAPLDTIHYCDNSQCAKGADVLFIGRDFRHTRTLLQSISGSHMLTVSNQPGFIDLGGMIGLIRRNHRLRFEINLTATRKAGIYISAELLQMATRIIGTNTP